MTARSARRNRLSTSFNRTQGPGSLARFVVLVALLAWTFRTFVGAPFNIPSGSMLPTLYIGDYVTVAKWPYGYSRFSFPFGLPALRGRILPRLPRRGDVVVFRHPSEDSDLIKRVIGLPGDRVAMRNGQLILNGRPVSLQSVRPTSIEISANSPCRVLPPAKPVVAQLQGHGYCLYRTYVETLPGGPSYRVLDQLDHGPADDFPEVQVPADRVFLMGDNRDDSLDSRYPEVDGGIGMVPTENLIGRAQFTFWSTDGTAAWFRPWSWFTALRVDRLGNSYVEHAR